MADRSNFREGDDRYEEMNDDAAQVSGTVNDNSYQSRTGQKDHIPVQKDEDPVGGADSGLDPNSDAQLERDESEAISKDNIIGGRTRGAKPEGSYSEGPDEDDLPTEALNSGRSGV